MAFSSSRTFALELLEEMDDVSDVMTCVTTSIFRRSWQGLRMAYTRMQHLYTMASAALSTSYTGRQKQSIFFAFGTISNFGILARQRSQALPFVFVLLALYPATRKHDLKGLAKPVALPQQ